MSKYINEEEALYRKLQKTVQESMKDDIDEYSDDGVNPTRLNQRFKLPKKMRGWFFLERARIPKKEHLHILANTGGGTNIDRLKSTMCDRMQDDILKELDEKSECSFGQRI